MSRCYCERDFNKSIDYLIACYDLNYSGFPRSYVNKKLRFFRKIRTVFYNVFNSNEVSRENLLSLIGIYVNFGSEKNLLKIAEAIKPYFKRVFKRDMTDDDFLDLRGVIIWLETEGAIDDRLNREAEIRLWD